MPKIIVILLLLLLNTQLRAEYRIVKSKNGKEISIHTLAKELQKYDLIFVGEEHGNPSIHAFQKELLPLLYKPKKKLILSFEMWERDTQEIVDAFLADEIDEASFISESRAWDNYQESYRPLLLFGKEHKLPVIAANVPRSYAGRVSRGGLAALAELPAEERRLIATNIHTEDDAYKSAFYEVMQRMGGHIFDDESLQRYYEAQCIKDDTMAESMVIALDYHKKAQIIHFNGAFHSNNFLGTVSRLQKSLPKLKIAVISPIFSEDWQSLNPDKELRQRGSYLLLLNKNSKEVAE